jgi:hypothetical protein
MVTGWGFDVFASDNFRMPGERLQGANPLHQLGPKMPWMFGGLDSLVWKAPLGDLARPIATATESNRDLLFAKHSQAQQPHGGGTVSLRDRSTLLEMNGTMPTIDQFIEEYEHDITCASGISSPSVSFLAILTLEISAKPSRADRRGGRIDRGLVSWFSAAPGRIRCPARLPG